MLDETLSIPACNCNTLRRAMRRISGFYDAQLAPSGLKATQFAILALLNHAGGLTVGEMAQKTDLDRTTAGKNLRPLEAMGLVAVTAAKEDGRRRAISLTRAGQAALKKALPLWQAAQAHFESKNENAPALRAQLNALVL